MQTDPLTERLLEHFDDLLTTPDDAAYLETAVFDLAVEGKLVPQDPNDESATELLKRIKAERKQLIQKKHIRKAKPLPPIEHDEIPYKVPEGWKWVRLSEIGEINPRNKADDNTEASFVPMRLIPTKYGQAHDSKKRPWREIKSGYTHFKENDVVVAKITPCFRNRKSVVMRDLANGIGAGTTEIFVFRGNPEHILPEYVLAFFKTPKFIEGGRSKMTGTAGQQRVPKNYVVQIPFPLPPLAEQKRIVAQVDELLAQTRALAAQLEGANAALVPTAQAAFHSLLDAPDTATQRQACQRIADHFDTLTSDPHTVEALKQTILQLAVQGKLVPQDPDDEPASVLLGHILAERRTKWEAEHPRKRYKEPVLPDMSELPELPTGWVWTTTGGLCECIVPNRDKPKTFTGTIPWITLPDFDDNQIEIANSESGLGLSEQETAKYKARVVPKGSVIMSCVGRFGIAAVLMRDAVINQQLHAFLVPENVVAKYLTYAIKTQVPFMERMSAATTIAYLNKSKCNSVPIALPPLAEQKRIVARVKALLSLCDALSAQVVQAQEVRARLLQAVLNGGQAE